MRVTFFTLLLANVIFLAWAQWIDRPPRIAAATSSDVPLLRLATPAAMDAKKSAPPAQCFSLGPFADDPAATTAAAALTAAGFQSHDRLVDAEVEDGYWVYVPALRDAAARRRALATLRAAGVRDAAVVSAPDQPDRVSAGVFTVQERAELRAAQVRFAGLDAVVEAREHHANQHWLDFQVRPGQAPPSLSAFASGPATPLKLQGCAGG